MGGLNLKKEMFLVGDIFMRKFYSVFDRDNDRVGIAEAVWWNYPILATVSLKQNKLQL